jgi:CHAT domain-containing protein
MKNLMKRYGIKQRRRWGLNPPFAFIVWFLVAILTITAAPGLASLSSPGLRTVTTSIAPAEQQGRSLYATGQYAEAAAAFEQAARNYQAAGDVVRQALSLSNLALCYQQLGQWSEANQTIATSLALLEPLEEAASALAQILDIQGSLQFAQGKANAALESWERSTALHDQLGNLERATETRINLAQAFQSLGLYRRAIALLYQTSGLEAVAPLRFNGTPVAVADLQPDELQTMLQTLSASPQTIAALQSLGEALRITGSLPQAALIVQHGLTLAEQLGEPEAIAASQLRWANLNRVQAFSTLAQENLTPEKAAELQRRQRLGRRCDQLNEATAFYEQVNRAIEFYQQASTGSAKTRLQAQLNQFSLLVDTEQWETAKQLMPALRSQLADLPPSNAAIQAQINLAQNLAKLKQEPGLNLTEAPACNQPLPAPNADLTFLDEAAELLATATQQARELQDPRAEAYALGALGQIYEQVAREQPDRLPEAQDLTQKALGLAQQINAPDIAYRLQWQLGRVLKAQGETQAAIAAYQESVITLQSIRGDLVAVSPEEQFSFRDTIEPIHRELVALLLASVNAATDAENLTAARQVIESLQLSELDNFFREACLNANPALIDEVDDRAVVLYPILLPNQLAVIASLPPELSNVSTRIKTTDTSSNLQCAAGLTAGGQFAARTLCYYTSSVSQAEIAAKSSTLRRDLTRQQATATTIEQVKQLGQEFYTWLLEPVANQLDRLQSEVGEDADDPRLTLVFVLDGALRNIPMASLYDGQSFLFQKYNVALTPGLQLLDAQPLVRDRFAALVGGLTEARQGFNPLPNVRQEVTQIGAIVDESLVLLDQGDTAANLQPFTSSNLATAISAVPYPIVHLATHGQFSSQLEKTFILTSDGQLTINQLRGILQTTAIRQEGALELLVLSACETAAGDDRAVLGLAGMAVRAGARSTVATLWKVDDAASAAFMELFYKELTQPNISKAEALRRAQVALQQSPEYQLPYFWAPYILVGNWQ